SGSGRRRSRPGTRRSSARERATLFLLSKVVDLREAGPLGRLVLEEQVAPVEGEILRARQVVPVLDALHRLAHEVALRAVRGHEKVFLLEADAALVRPGEHVGAALHARLALRVAAPLQLAVDEGGNDRRLLRAIEIPDQRRVRGDQLVEAALDPQARRTRRRGTA